jgi:hypothetical protein|uniref:Uncharacterized protein n=1 Tax=Desulfobacca acetoxidans TaxID=60893 RepID=A0A7V6A2K5_9BACT
MQPEVTVPEVFNVFKEISEAPEKLFDMLRLDLRGMAGDCLTVLEEWGAVIHVGRKRYERSPVSPVVPKIFYYYLTYCYHSTHFFLLAKLNLRQGPQYPSCPEMTWPSPPQWRHLPILGRSEAER